MLVEYLPCSRHCAGQWEYSSKKNPCLRVADILMGKTPDKRKWVVVKELTLFLSVGEAFQAEGTVSERP